MKTVGYVQLLLYAPATEKGPLILKMLGHVHLAVHEPPFYMQLTGALSSKNTGIYASPFASPAFLCAWYPHWDVDRTRPVWGLGRAGRWWMGECWDGPIIPFHMHGTLTLLSRNNLILPFFIYGTLTLLTENNLILPSLFACMIP